MVLFYIALFLRLKKEDPATDLELIGRYRETGDSSYVGELFQRYTHLAFGVCMKYFKNEADSKDAVMELFEKLLVDLKKHEVNNFKSWLHTVTRNHCLMQLRKEKSESKKEEVWQKTEIDFVESEQLLHPPSENTAEIRLNNLEGALKELKPEQRQCVELFYLQDKCYNEVAEITGFPIKKVKSYLQNGKRNLKIALSNHQPK